MQPFANDRAVTSSSTLLSMGLLTGQRTAREASPIADSRFVVPILELDQQWRGRGPGQPSLTTHLCVYKQPWRGGHCRNMDRSCQGKKETLGWGVDCMGPVETAEAMNPSGTQSQHSEGPTTSYTSQALGLKNQPGRHLRTQVAGPSPEFLLF